MSQGLPHRDPGLTYLGRPHHVLHSSRRACLWYPVSPIMDFLLPALHFVPAGLHPVFTLIPTLCQDLHASLPPGSFPIRSFITLSNGTPEVLLFFVGTSHGLITFHLAF